MAQTVLRSSHRLPPPIACQSVIDAMPDGVAVCSAGGEIVLANAALHRLLGYPAPCLVGADLPQLLPRAGLNEVFSTRFAAISERRDGVARRGDGALIPVEVTLGGFENDGQPHLLVTLRDIFQRLQAEKKLRENATHDGLTGLLTRATLMQVSEVELLRSRRYGRAWSVIMLDIDHFKAINDHHGHPTGDKVLAGVAEACRNLLRGCDVIGRYGGEEFLAVLPETDAKGALAVAERIRHQVQGCQPAGPSIAVTISAGIAALTASVFDLGTLIGAADRALYRAKRAGRNRVELA